MRGMTRVPGAATGALFGLALGDALGKPTEFLGIPAIEAAFGPWRELPLPDPALITDDTQMTLAVARALRALPPGTALEPEPLAAALRAEYVEWWRSPENDRAPGRTCLTACEALADADLPWRRASELGSKGCGANMRVVPAGLLPGADEETRAGVAQLQSALTHGHPTALAASELTAEAVHLLAHGTAPADLVDALVGYARERRSVYRGRWLGDLWALGHDVGPVEFARRGWDDCLAALDRVRWAVRAADREGDPCRATGAGWIAEEALATGLFCFLLFPAEPVTALRRAACTSGDSDSIACLAGAFAGAHLGAGAWPREWTGRVEHAAELAALGAAWDA
jgi:ADP-ribosylglycohydrolase